MRTALRLLAAVKPAAGGARYLEPGAMTGLTGVYTHRSPRSTLLYLYGLTLDKLQAFPPSSLYRQSVEAVTKHRLGLVEAAIPPGYEAWAARAQKVLAENSEQFTLASGRVDGSGARTVTLGGKTFLVGTDHEAGDPRYEEWNGEKDEGPELEGERSPKEREEQVLIGQRKALEEVERVEWEAEPQLTADQIEELENKIGAGLIEEVIEVAESELKLVDIMQQSKVWEPLEEKPDEGQWVYFERKSM